MLKFKMADVISNIRDIVVENPDEVYIPDPICAYEKNGDPDCLVARGMRKAGMPIGLLKAFDARTDDTGIKHIVLHAEDEFGIMFVGSSIERKWLENVQCAQDAGKEFSRAIELADDRMSYDD